MKNLKKLVKEFATKIDLSKKTFFILVILLVVTSLFFIRNLWNTAITNASKQSISIAETAEASLSKELLSRLDVSAQDINKPEYDSLKANLSNIIKVNSEFHFAYIYVQKNDRIYFVVDSEPADSEDYSPPGQEYTEATETDKKPFQDGQTLITEPTTDRWGTWISILVPMKDARTGAVIAVFGMDYAYESWNKAVISNVIPGVIYAIALFVLLHTVYIIILKNRKMKASQTVLQESEEKYRRLSDVTLEGIVIYKKGVIQDINPSLLKMLGYQRGEMLDKNIAEFIHGDDIQVVLENVARNYGEPYEVRLVRKNGESFLAEVEGREFQLQGETMRVASVRDVTRRKQIENELKESNARIRAITDSAQDGIIMMDQNGIISFWNPSAERIIGYTSEEAIGQTLHKFIVPERHFDAHSAAYPLFQKTGAGGAVGKTLDLEARRKDSTEVFVQLSLSAAHMSNGWHAVGILRDITDQKKAEIELISAKETAEEATNAKSEFLANMSHEIRTPMNAVIGFSELIKKTDMTAKQLDYVNKINSSAKSLLGIINDILDFSKIEAGKLELENVSFRLDNVIDNIMSMNSNRAAEKGIELVSNTEEKVPNFLIGDPLRVGQVLLNLVNNAVKFTDQGHVLVETKLIKKEDQRCLIQFSVSDTGIGLTAEQKDKLFSAFSQADTSVTRRFGGTGLGLTISKRLVEMMNGKISIESEFGSGSIFTFIIEFMMQAEEKTSKTANKKELQNLRILIVDDNEVSRELLKEQIDDFGVIAVSAASAREAITEIENQSEQNPYDLVIMDWRMPGMDGIEAVKAILENKKIQHIPKTIMVSAFGREEVVRNATAAGVNAFLMKPINQSLLFDTILNIFDFEKNVGSIQNAKTENGKNSNERIDGISILLVEDNAINQEVATEILTSAGAKVDIANNGKEAVDAVKMQNYDVVLMDLQMPIMGGYEATKLIRVDEKNKELPIIAMTAHAMQGVQAECFEAGMNDYVSKPIDSEDLFAKIVKWAKPNNLAGKQQRITFTVQSDRENEGIILPESIAGLDMQTGIGRVNGNIKLYRKLLFDFGKNYAAYAREIEKALDNRNTADAKRFAHTLKGVAGNISANDIQSIAAQIERALASEENDSLEGLLKDLDTALGAICKAVSELDYNVQTEKVVLEKEVNTSDIEPILRRLAHLVWEDDIDAEKTLEEMKILCGPRFAKEIAQISESIEGFDFEAAKSPIGNIAKEINIRLDGETHE